MTESTLSVTLSQDIGYSPGYTHITKLKVHKHHHM